MDQSRAVEVVMNGTGPVNNNAAKSVALASSDADRVPLSKSLTDAWNEVSKKLSSATSGSSWGHKKQAYNFKDVPTDLDGFLDKWGTVYEHDESNTSRKKKQVLSIIQNVIEGFQTVGSIAAEGASIAWPPAGVCFSALSFLLDIPSRIKHVFDTIMDLFEEVEAFFVRFKVLKLLDDRGRLDLSMVERSNKILISFVEICCMSFNLLENHKVKTSLKAALLNNDSGTGDTLIGFRNEAKLLDSLTNTVALSHIIAIQETGEDTNMVARDTQGIVRSLVAGNNDEKTKMLNEARVRRTEEKIYAKGERDLVAVANKIQQTSFELLKGTLSVLEQDEKLKQWKDSPSSRAALLLTGASGTGKSCALEALKASLDNERLNAKEGEPSVYVALHVFDVQRQRASERAEQMSTAIRSMAAQVAWTSLRYAKELEKQLQRPEEQDNPIKDIPNPIELWKTLKLSTFDAPLGATMYLLFDGIEQPDEIDFIRKLFVESSAEDKHLNDTLKIRAIATIDTSKPELRSAFEVPRIPMDIAMKSLVSDYAEKQMKRRGIFQNLDKKSKALKSIVTKAFEEVRKPPKNVNAKSEDRYWTFKDVEIKLDRIHDAINSGGSSKTLEYILGDESNQTTDLEAKKKFDAVLSTLTAEQVSQLHQLLPWTAYCSGRLQFEELEAAMFLTNGCDSLQSISQMMNTSFGDLFHIFLNTVILKDEFRDILTQDEAMTILGSHSKSPLISLHISIDGAEESVVRQFVWQLNEQMSSGKLDFSSHTNDRTKSVYTNQINGHLTIAKICLKLLNEGWNKETEDLVSYARNSFLTHISSLYGNTSKISDSDLREVTRGLTSYLSNPYHLVNDPDRHFGDWDMLLSSPECAQNIQSWLKYTSKLLEPRDQRWIKKTLEKDEGQIGFLKDVALSVGHKWITHTKTNASERMKEQEWCRSSNSLEVYLFAWLNSFIELYESSRASGQQELNKATTDTEFQGEETDDLQSPMKMLTEKVSNGYKDGLAATSSSENDLEHKDEIQRALEWLDRNRVNICLTGTYYINIGYTYLYSDRYEKAEANFKLAMEQDAFKQQALMGLGRVKWMTEQKEEGLRLMIEAADMLDDYMKNLTPVQREDELYAEFSREIALMYEDLGMRQQAIERYKRYLENEDDPRTRWRLLKLLSETDVVKSIPELLNEWFGTTDGPSGKGLGEIFYRLADNDSQCEEIESWVHTIRDDNLRDIVEGGLAEAVKIANNEPFTRATPGLLFCQGIVTARDCRHNRHEIAFELWKEALHLKAPADVDWGYRCKISAAAACVGQHEFDRMRKLLLSNSMATKSIPAKRDFVKQLRDKLHDVKDCNRNISELSLFPATSGFVTSMNVLLGLSDDLDAGLMIRMSIALDMLQDDDLENDGYSITQLLWLFCALGDKVGALSSFSLLGRLGLEHLPDCGSCGRKNVHEDFWCCQFCYEWILCNACHQDFIAHRLKLHRCNPEHKFICFYHPEYSREEQEGTKVRIDWEYVDLRDGRFERRGGRIVELSEWVEQLRVMWKIPEPDKEIRAQK